MEDVDKIVEKGRRNGSGFGLQSAFDNAIFRNVMQTEREEDNVKKLLLADTSEVFCKAVLSILGDDYEACACGDGLQAAKMLKEFQPDILVTDLTLPGMDGLGLLRTAAEMTNRPVLLVATRIYTPFAEAAMEQIQVDYVMRKPCDLHCLAERIQELTGCQRQPEVALRPVSNVDGLLVALKINACRDGYGYLKRVIDLYLQNPGRSLTKDLYPTAGQTKQVSGLAVERAMRSVIGDAWLHRDENVWRCYFPTDSQGHVPRPTNKEFIVAVARATSEQQRRWA